jgi:hypothetical protein
MATNDRNSGKQKPGQDQARRQGEGNSNPEDLTREGRSTDDREPLGAGIGDTESSDDMDEMDEDLDDDDQRSGDDDMIGGGPNRRRNIG